MMNREVDFAALEGLLKPGQVITNPVELMTYEVDAASDRGLPDAVILPRSQEDVAMVVRWAVERGLPVVARGAGTGLSGGAVAAHGGLVLSFSQMDQMLDFDPCGRIVEVEPGVINLRLDTFVREAGLYYPPDPASGRTATIGGNLAENAGGPHCFKYGVTTNYVTGLDIVLADGDTIRLGGRALDYPEYDFMGLQTGGEGTLGVITKASLRLLRYPPAVRTLMAAFDSVEAAGEAVSAIIARGLVPATMEFMDQKMMRIIEDYAQAGLPVEAGAALIIEVDGYPESLSPQMEEIVEVLQRHQAWDMRLAESVEERELIWYGRKSAAGAMARLSPAYYLLDGTTPRSRLASTLLEINRVCEALELRVAYVFHAGDGNLHPFILIEDPSDQALVERAHRAGRQVMEICVKQGGSITGEHGVGLEKRQFMPLMFGETELAAMKGIKRVFDPGGVMNPGKVFPNEQYKMDSEPHSVSGGQSSVVGGHLVEPGSAQEAAEMVRDRVAAGRSIRLRGAGTKSGLLPRADCLLSTGGLSAVREVALQDLYITVGAGARLADLQARLADDGMWLPLVSPWPEATVGGILATNFNAPLRMRYGALRDLLLAVAVVLPDGRLASFGRPVVKNVAGYDMPKLFVGAHGTLGLVTEATLKLAPAPRARRSLIAPVDGLEGGIQVGMELLQVCLTASALLLCGGANVGVSAPYALIYTAEGLEGDVAAELEQALSVLHRNNLDAVLETGERSGNQVWAEWIETVTANGMEMPLLRIGIPASQALTLIQSLPEAFRDADFIADLANGLIYLQFAGDLAGLQKATLDLGGYAILLAGSQEYARAQNLWGYRPGSLELMRRLKVAWDPRRLFNPGVFVV